MINFKEIFKDYVVLNYSGSGFNTISKERIVDVDISDYIIARITRFGNYIIYLHTGSSLFIPIPWVNLFSGLDVYYGDRVINQDLEEFSDIIDKVGIIFTKVIYSLDKRIITDPPEFLNMLGELSYLGTKKFRVWCEEEFDIVLKPIEYKDLRNEVIEI